MIKNSLGFIESLPDTRYLLFYPDITNKLYNMILDFSENQIELSVNIFGELITSLFDKRKILADLIRNSSTNLLSILFPTVLLVDVKTMRNNQIPPIRTKDILISQAMFSFTNDQFKALLTLLTINGLNILLDTLKPYQVSDLLTIYNIDPQKISESRQNIPIKIPKVVKESYKEELSFIGVL